MQKKLLTLAVAGALAAPGVALAQVEVYGTIHMSVDKMKYAEPTQFTAATCRRGRHGSASELGRRSRTPPTSACARGKPRRRTERLGAGGDQRVDGALEQRRAHVELRLAQLRGRYAGQLRQLLRRPVDHAVGGPRRAVGHRHGGDYGPVTSIIGRRETTGSAPNPNCVERPVSAAPRRGLVRLRCDWQAAV